MVGHRSIPFVSRNEHFKNYSGGPSSHGPSDLHHFRGRQPTELGIVISISDSMGQGCVEHKSKTRFLKCLLIRPYK
jgi:hypothetical protein